MAEGKSQPTSLYLDDETKVKLEKLSAASGESMSQIMRGLIRGADGSKQKRLAKVVAELNDLVGT